MPLWFCNCVFDIFWQFIISHYYRGQGSRDEKFFFFMGMFSQTNHIKKIFFKDLGVVNDTPDRYEINNYYDCTIVKEKTFNWRDCYPSVLVHHSSPSFQLDSEAAVSTFSSHEKWKSILYFTSICNSIGCTIKISLIFNTTGNNYLTRRHQLFVFMFSSREALRTS